MRVLVLLGLLVATAYGAEQCTSPLDLVLVVEDSSVLAANDEDNLRKFGAAIVNYLTIDKQHTPISPFDQAAYVLYNSISVPIFHLNKYTETADARSAVLTQHFNRTAEPPAVIAQALNHVYDEELRVANGERSCYQTVVVLVSYSKFEDPNGVNAASKATQDPLDLTASRRIQQAGGLVITVGVGKGRDPAHLMKLASNESWYYDYESFDDLTEDEAVRIVQRLCIVEPDGNFYPCEMQTIAADFTFVVDVSNEFTADFANDIINFVQNFLDPYKYNHKDGVQAALVTYSKTSAIDVYLKDKDHLDEFIRKANESLFTALACAECRTSDRCINAALENVMYHIFVEDKGYRPTCALHQVYIFTSGCFNCDNNIDPIPVASRIKDEKNAEIFVVTLQHNQPDNKAGFGFWKEPLEIASDYSHLYEPQADPTSILPNYMHKQSWRTVCVSNGNVTCPISSTTSAAVTPTISVTASTTPPP